MGGVQVGVALLTDAIHGERGQWVRRPASRTRGHVRAYMCVNGPFEGSFEDHLDGTIEDPFEGEARSQVSGI